MAQTYRASVEAQRKADATPIPKLTARAEAAVTLLAAADENAGEALWHGITVDKSVGVELEYFSTAVQQRSGDDTVRGMLRSRGGLVEAASVPRRHQIALAAVSRTVHTISEGEYAGARQAEAARLAQH